MLEKLIEKIEKKVNLINRLTVSEIKKGVDIDDLNKIKAKIDAEIDDALNDICSMMCKKRKNNKKINMNKRARILNSMYRLLLRLTYNTHHNIDGIYIDMLDVSELDIDKLHLIDDKLNKIKAHKIKNLIKLRDILCQ